jgi:CTP synthase (UTP-ammonia lyase)
MEPRDPRRIRVGLIGDRDASVRAHEAAPRALELAAGPSLSVETRWLPTPSLERDLPGKLAGIDALWCVPGSPYASMEGALSAIRFARENGRVFLGTCGGFQHALLEYARNVMGLPGAAHAETSPGAEAPFISPLSCSLVGKTGTIHFRRESKAAVLYGALEAVEAYHCSFGLNPEYQGRLDGGGMSVTGVDADGTARVAELGGHPFFLATLFQPELSALGENAAPHPLIVGFVRAAAARRAREDTAPGSREVG